MWSLRADRRRREGPGLMSLRWLGETGDIAIRDEAGVTRQPVRNFRAVLFPVDERRLIAPVIKASHDAAMRFSADVGVHRTAFLPGSAGPVGVVRVGENIGAKVAGRTLGLLNGSHCAGEELVKERGVLQPQPGDE